MTGIEKTGPVIAVDGPSASGKSTVSTALAERLGLPYISTGLMYRALAARALARGAHPDDATRLEELARELSFELSPGPLHKLLIDGRPPGPELLTPEVEAIVSAASRHPGVRAALRAEQRRLGAAGSIMDGRDIGSVVFPDADVKLFLWAEPGVRVDRRELERGDVRLADAVARRDAIDARTSPPRPAPGATMIDTTALTLDEVVAEALRIVQAALDRTSIDPPQ
jgi:cytidylate kinase